MMEKLSMCRICLIKDVRLHCLVITNLEEIYELLSGNLLETKDTRPLHACYMCCARLRNCLRLRTACLHSEELFSHLLENDSWEVTPSQGMTMLQTKPVMNMDLGPVGHWELQLDPIRTKDERQHEKHVGDLQDNIIDQGICTQIMKSEDIKSENVGLEDDELDYNILNIKVENVKLESQSASDNSCVGDGTQEILRCNESISSVDLQDICDKPVKIEVQQMDLSTFPKPATVTMHLNRTDLEYTSQCNNLNYSENVEMLRPNICEKSFSKKSVLNVQFRRTHNKRYTCDKCERSFTSKSYLLVHIRSHTGEKPFQCPKCDKGFKQSSHLIKHIRSHTGEKPFRCPTCDKGFIQKNNLTTHIRTHTGEKPFQCPTCNKCFNQIGNLTKHIRTHTGEKPYKCDKCEKGFTTKSELLCHTPYHTREKLFRCPTCDKGFNHNSHLTAHIRTHTGEKPYKCDSCGKGFTRKDYLTCHIRTHTHWRIWRR